MTSEVVILMSRPPHLIHARRTERECPLCEEGVIYETESREQLCGTCSYVSEKLVRPRKGEWEKFFEAREEYSGHYGEDRVRPVGGFIGAYVYGDGGSIADRLYG